MWRHLAAGTAERGASGWPREEVKEQRPQWPLSIDLLSVWLQLYSKSVHIIVKVSTHYILVGKELSEIHASSSYQRNIDQGNCVGSLRVCIQTFT